MRMECWSWKTRYQIWRQIGRRGSCEKGGISLKRRRRQCLLSLSLSVLGGLSYRLPRWARELGACSGVLRSIARWLAKASHPQAMARLSASHPRTVACPGVPFRGKWMLQFESFLKLSSCCLVRNLTLRLMERSFGHSFPFLLEGMNCMSYVIFPPATGCQLQIRTEGLRSG